MIVHSEGFRVNGLFFEPFSLKKGEYVVINMPSPLDFEAEKTMFSILSGQKPQVGVMHNERIVPVLLPLKKWRIFPFSTYTPATYLGEGYVIRREDIKHRLREIAIEPNIAMWQLSVAERMLLALEKAYMHSKNVILTTSGIGYMGLDRVRARLTKEMPHGSMIELNYESSRGREYLFENPSQIINTVRM